MILEFYFYQIYENGVLCNILHKILCKMQEKAVITEGGKEVFLYVKGDEKELENFANIFSSLFPVSLFFRFLKTEIVDSMPRENEFKKCEIPLPFSLLDLQNFKEENKKDFPFSLEEIDEKINLLKQGNLMRLSTLEGVKSIGLVKEEFKNNLDNINYIIPTDLSLLQKMVVATKEQLNALVSFEKPIIEFKLNLIFKNKNLIKSDFVRVKMCDSLLLFCICEKLFKSGEEFLFVSDELVESGLVYDLEEIKSPYISVLENSSFIQLENNSFMNNPDLPSFKKKAHERFSSVMYEYNLFEKKNLSFFLSKSHDDFVMTYDKKNGLNELIYIKIPNSFEQIFNDISQDENGKKLVENFKKTYPNLVQNAFKIDILDNMPNNFYTLLGIAGVLLGYGKNLHEASKNLLLNAKKCSNTKGPRIDVKLVNDKFPSHINVAKFIQSGLSFKLAEVENETLSFGYLESIAYFISDMSDLVAKELEIDSVSLCGELFGFSRLLEITAKNIQANHKIYINKAFSIE